ncbi:MAG: DinB family protein [Planctomycetota bacterium]|jgi:uncharacterized damage-inducible protein DinB
MSPTTLLLLNLDYAFEKAAWHGTTLRGALRGLAVAEALWRPAPDRHSIWEELLHCAYWKYIACRRLDHGRPARFPRSPSNWPQPPSEPSEELLRADIALLREEHAMLRAAVAAFPPSGLGDRVSRKGPTYAQMILGIAAHDLYHTGQIQLTKRLKGRRA